MSLSACDECLEGIAHGRGKCAKHLGDEKVERRHKDQILRRVARQLAAHGFARTKPTYMARLHPPVIEFIHFHKYSFCWGFRIHWGIRVLNDAWDAIALNGPDSTPYQHAGAPGGKRYNLDFHLDPATVERCTDNVVQLFCEVIEPWFLEFRDPLQLLSRSDSPLTDHARTALQAALAGEADPVWVAQSRHLLKVP